MAKLPDIQYRRRVPTLESPAMAALPTKLRNIQAGVSAARQVSQQMDRAFETESQLDAGRRFQQVQKEYTTARADLLQEYHDTDKPLEEFENEVRTLRQKTFEDAREGMSGRTSKYLEPKLGGLDVEAEVFEKETLMKLTESRSKLHLARGSDDRVTMAENDPGYTQHAIESFNEQVRVSGLSQVDKRAAKTSNATRVMTVGIEEHLRRGNVEAAVKLVESANFNQLPDRERAALTEQVVDAGYAQMNIWAEENANLALLGGAEIDPLLAEAETQVPKITVGLTEDEEQTTVLATQGELAYRYFQGLNIEGKGAEVLEQLKSNKYNKMLSPSQTRELYAAAQGSVAKGGMNVNAGRARLKSDIRKATAALANNPEIVMNPVTDQQVQQYFDALEDTYTMQGKDPAETVETLKIQWEDAKQAAAVTVGVWQDPNAAYEVQANTPRNTVEGARLTQEIQDALTKRSEKIKTDTMQFAESMGVPITKLERTPNVSLDQDVAWFDGLGPRFMDYAGLETQLGADMAGPLYAREVGQVNMFLKSQPTADALMTFAGQVAARLDVDQSTELFSQLDDSEELGVLPTVGRLVAWGDPLTAENILVGQQYLTTKGDTFKPEQVSQVEQVIREELGSAYGPYGDSAYEQTFRASYALYAQKIGAASNREGGLGFDRSLAEEAVRQATGGIYEVGDQTFVAPQPGVNKTTFTRWLQSQDASTLPAVVDGNGTPIPPQDIADGLYDNTWMGGGRFYLTPTGTPGKYYITDARGRSQGRRTDPAGPGLLLMSAEDKSRPAVMRFDASEIRQTVPVRQGQGGR